MTQDVTRPIVGIENRNAQEVFDIMCDRFQSLRSQPEPAGARVGVKPLEWKENGAASLWTGELAFGAYYTAYDEGNGWRAFRGQFLSEVGDVEIAYGTKSVVLAAAQADYERRILSALTEQKGEAVGLFRKTDGAWKQVPDEWGDHPNVQPLYASPTNQEPVAVTDAARDILAERQRQVEAEGWTTEHDDEHTRGEMSEAAACYAAPNSVYWGPDRSRAGLEWPWDVSWWKPCDGKRGRPLDRRRDLVKAAALLLAEIERLDRAAALSQTQEE